MVATKKTPNYLDILREMSIRHDDFYQDTDLSFFIAVSAFLGIMHLAPVFCLVTFWQFSPLIAIGTSGVMTLFFTGLHYANRDICSDGSTDSIWLPFKAFSLYVRRMLA